MLDRVDRMLVAVRNRAQACETFARMLGAGYKRELHSDFLNARCAVMSVGETEVELCEPLGAGPVAAHLDQWGEGLFKAGYSSKRLPDLAAHLARLQVPHAGADGRIYLPGSSTYGFPMVISNFEARPREGLVSFFYEATNTLDTDWRIVSRRYAEMFGLDESRFSPIKSDRFGYEGTLTLFDPVRGLDRIELSQTFADKPSAMRRFVDKRGGDSMYMCFIETHDFVGLKNKLLAAGATLTPQDGTIAEERNSMWVHPKNLHGLLLGVSRTDYAWSWSGQKERVPVL